MTSLQGPCSRRTRRKGQDECPRLEGIKVRGMMLGMWAHGMNCVWGQQDWARRGVQNLAPVPMGTVRACPECCSTNGWENRRTDPSWPEGALGKCGSRIWKEQHRPTKCKPACNFSPKPLRVLPGRAISTGWRGLNFLLPLAAAHKLSWRHMVDSRHPVTSALMDVPRQTKTNLDTSSTTHIIKGQMPRQYTTL